MTGSGHRFQDRDLELLMGNLLRWGVLIAATVVLLGGGIYLMQYGHELMHYRHFDGEPAQLQGIGSIWTTALQGHGRSIIQLGILILIATPIFRIIASIFGYVLERDWKYVVITLLVLSVILSGF